MAVGAPVPASEDDPVIDIGDPKRLHHAQEAINGGNSIKYADTLPVEVYGAAAPGRTIPDPARLRGVAALHTYRS